jgi:hypothetical protein
MQSEKKSSDRVATVDYIRISSWSLAKRGGEASL